MSARHTPTPWHIHRKADASENDLPWIAGHMGRPLAFITHETILREDLERANANAAFIVRACNAHDELVAALKLVQQDVRGETQSCGVVPNTTMHVIHRALAKAEAL